MSGKSEEDQKLNALPKGGSTDSDNRATEGQRAETTESSSEKAPDVKDEDPNEKRTPSSDAAGTAHGAAAPSQPGARRVYPRDRQPEHDDEDAASDTSEGRRMDSVEEGAVAGVSGRDNTSDSPEFDAVLMGEAVTSESGNEVRTPDVPTGDSADFPQDNTVVAVEAVKGYVIKRRRIVWLVIGLIVVICIIAVVLWETLSPGPQQGTSAPSFHLPAALEKLVLSLPSYTQETLRSELPSSAQTTDWYKNGEWSNESTFEPVSSQGKAWKWLMSDPRLESRNSRDILYRFALATFYYATNGTGWRNNTNWLSLTEDICTWWHSDDASYSQNHGYEDVCRRAGFAALNVPQNNLVGTIPPELSLISSLTLVKLFSNSLGGTVPRDVWNSWKGVDVLQLHDNSLTGTIPVVIGEFSRLLYFFVHFNAFTGTLPTEIGNLRKLKQILISNNQIEGKIPTELGKLKSSLSVIFDATNNTLTGTIPTELGKISALRYFDVRDNRLFGTIPSQLSSCSSLFFLLTANNHLTGTIPTELGRLSGLVILDLSGNDLTGALPSQVGLLTGLTSFDTTNNRIQGPIPSEVGQLVQLTSLRISHTRVTGTVPESLCLALLPENGINEIVIDCDRVSCTCNCTCD